MKKIISIFAIVFAVTLVMSIPAFAEGFTAGTATGATVTGAADKLTVSMPATKDAEYTVLLVAGDSIPTVGSGTADDPYAESSISYINQYTAEGDTLEFEVLPLMDAVSDEGNTLFIGSNAENFELISVPVTYAEAVEEPENDYITSEDTGKATIVADVAKNGVASALSDTSMGDAVGNYVISVALDTTAYPAAGGETAGYIVKAVNADGTDVEGASVFYSKERAKYVALVPSTVADYKFEVLAADTEGATANDVITKYGNINFDAKDLINSADLLPFRQIIKKTKVATLKVGLCADISGDGKINSSDLLQFRKAVKGQSYNFAVLSK